MSEALNTDIESEATWPSPPQPGADPAPDLDAIRARYEAAKLGAVGFAEGVAWDAVTRRPSEWLRRIALSADDVPALLALADRLTAENAELRKHAGHTPNLDRIRTAHSLMTAENFSLPGGWGSLPHGGHRIYKQEGESRCYLCALLVEIAALQTDRDRLAARLIESEAELAEGDRPRSGPS